MEQPILVVVGLIVAVACGVGAITITAQSKRISRLEAAQAETAERFMHAVELAQKATVAAAGADESGDIAELYDRVSALEKRPRVVRQPTKIIRVQQPAAPSKPRYRYIDDFGQPCTPNNNPMLITMPCYEVR
jgi:hypothetical protein